MNFVVSVVQILLAAALHLSTVKTASIKKGLENSKNEAGEQLPDLATAATMLSDRKWGWIRIQYYIKLIPFTEVITKSMCQPREVLVDILQEYPEETEHNYIPSCVVVKRCGGCCNDEAMECVPTETHNVTLQVMRVRPMVTQHTIDLSFTEHQRCDCRLKPDVQAKNEYHCAPCSERRKHLFVQDPLTCKCSCKFTQLDCKSRRLELNQRTCRCEKPRR